MRGRVIVDGVRHDTGLLFYGIVVLHKGLTLLVDFAAISGQTYLRWGPQLGLSW